MQFARVKRLLAKTLAGLALSAGALAPAQSAVYTGTWDPAFGSAFPDLGWSGAVTFYVPDACLALSGLVLNGNGCSGGTMELLSAEVSFYSLSQPNNPALQETLSFDDPATGFPWMLGMTIQGGTVTGLIGAFDYLLPSTLAIAGAPNTSFGLGFLGDSALMLYYNSADHQIGLSDLYRAAGQSNTHMTFAPAVPEPGTYALMLAGLAVLVWVQRRRRPE